MDPFSFDPRKRLPSYAFAPYERLEPLSRSAHGGTSGTSNAVAGSPNVDWFNAHNSRFTGIHPSYGDARTAQLPARGDPPGQRAYERTVTASSERNHTTPLWSSEVAYAQDHRPHPISAVSTITLSDGAPPQQTAVPIAVPHPHAQTVPVGANNGVYSSGYVHPSHNWLNLPTEGAPRGEFNGSTSSEVNIINANEQPQLIYCGCVNHALSAVATDLLQTPAGYGGFRMDMYAYNMTAQNSPARQYDEQTADSRLLANSNEWSQTQQPITFPEPSFGSVHSNERTRKLGSQQPHRPYDDIAEDRFLVKHEWPDSSEAGPSGVQHNATPTKHSQPRPIVGSPANTRATEKRRKTKASFTCDQCRKTFTRKHNLTNHIRAHLGKAGVKCALCSAHLAKSSLSRHMKKCKGS